jgi:hypothetical protein
MLVFEAVTCKKASEYEGWILRVNWSSGTLKIMTGEDVLVTKSNKNVYLIPTITTKFVFNQSTFDEIINNEFIQNRLFIWRVGTQLYFDTAPLKSTDNYKSYVKYVGPNPEYADPVGWPKSLYVNPNGLLKSKIIQMPHKEMYSFMYGKALQQEYKENVNTQTYTINLNVNSATSPFPEQASPPTVHSTTNVHDNYEWMQEPSTMQEFAQKVAASYANKKSPYRFVINNGKVER